MGNIELQSASIANLVQLNNTWHIGSGLMLFDNMNDLRMPDGVCRITDIMVGICLQGGARYTANTVEYGVLPNDVLIIPDGLVMGEYTMCPGSQGICMMLSPDFFHEVVKDIHDLSSLIIFSRSHPVFSLLPKEVASMVNYYNLIKEKIGSVDGAYRKDVARYIISAMICELCNAIGRFRDNAEEKRTRGERIFTDFIRLVEENFRQERRVSWYGEQMCITPKYLSETVKAVSCRTPNEWIDNYVVMELRALLKDTSKSIKEIAHDMNFPNQSFLGKYFKEHVGVSPMTYRRS